MLVYFVRHGESEANVLNVFSNRGTKHPLTSRGREQVEMLAGKLADVNFGAFYSSPVWRATESAEILSRRLGISYEVTEALREYSAWVLFQVTSSCSRSCWDNRSKSRIF